MTKFLAAFLMLGLLAASGAAATASAAQPPHYHANDVVGGNG
jgi:hypothetical protein